MKELVEVIAKALVDHPEEVTVTETEKDNATVVELRVSPTDMGKVIGKQGRIAKAIRSVVKAAASRDDKKVLRSYSKTIHKRVQPGAPGWRTVRNATRSFGLLLSIEGWKTWNSF